jgi:agmatine deiminase
MSRLLNSTPLDDGFHMPGEFEPHSGCWMLWPQRPDVWRDNARFGQQAFVATARAIVQFEPVTVCASAEQFQNARSMLPESVRVVEIPSNDAWIRDCGPSFVTNGDGAIRGVDWEFNAWGGLYSDWQDDNRVAQKVLSLAGADRYKAPCVVEGGAIHVDGEGTLITTSSCLLNANRNPQYSKAQMEDLLMAYTGSQKVIWLDFEAHEETDGHIDGICAFVKPGVLVLDWCDDPQKETDYALCRQLYEQLMRVTDARGRSFEIHKLPAASPPPISREEAAGIVQVAGSFPRKEGDPVWGTYTNFYIANGGIVMPTYDDPNDEPAQRILSDLYSDRKVVCIPARELAMCGGMIHCITQQQPALSSPPLMSFDFQNR